eukprot:3986827-Amphidinium_carterae.1
MGSGKEVRKWQANIVSESNSIAIARGWYLRRKTHINLFQTLPFYILLEFDEPICGVEQHVEAALP